MTGISFSLEVFGLPPIAGDKKKTALLISDAKNLMRKIEFQSIRNQAVAVHIEFRATSASGVSDPLGIISGIVIGLEKAGVYASRSAIRNISFTRTAGDKTGYTVLVTAEHYSDENTETE